MGKLTPEEQKQLDELAAKRDAPDEPEESPDDDEDQGVIVLRGSRADSFLAQIFGTGKKKKKPANPPAGDDDGQGDDGQGDDDGDGDGDQPPPPPGHRYFR